MIEGVGEAIVRRPPEAIIAFVTSLEQHKRADLKIGRVLESRREGDVLFMRHDGKLRGIPGPAVSLEMVVVGTTSVRYRSVPTFPSRLVLDFDGGFELHHTADGTRVIHTERFRFFAPPGKGPVPLPPGRLTRLQRKHRRFVRDPQARHIRVQLPGSNRQRPTTCQKAPAMSPPSL